MALVYICNKYFTMRISILILSISLSLMIQSCQPPKKNADLIVLHARVYKVDSSFSVAEAFAVKDGMFVDAGTDEEILARWKAEKEIDASGKFIYPGFNDAHCHFLGFGENLIRRADLTGTASMEEVVKRLREHFQKHQPGWLEGRGWDQNDWENRHMPDNRLLNEAFPDIPVYIIRIDGHAALANDYALKLAGIMGDETVAGGTVVTRNGKPTGLLIDNAMDLVSIIIPASDEENIKKALLLAQRECFGVGLTSVTDAGLELKAIRQIEKLQKNDSLKIRINAMISPTPENFEYFLPKGPVVQPRLIVRSIKLYADGALGSRGAWLLEPYTDAPETSGLSMHPEVWYDSICSLAARAGYQVNIHAIGDRANRTVLNIFSKYTKGKDLRWRIEHAQVVHPDDIARFGELNVVPSVQPTHATSDMYWAVDRLGPERLKGAYAYRSLLNATGWLPLGTDFPIESINPVNTFYAAITRQDATGYPPGGFFPEQALTRTEALKGITLWPARASFEENVKGSIEPGKYADFVILDTDLMQEDPVKLLQAKVLSTYIGGECVYTRQ